MYCVTNCALLFVRRNLNFWRIYSVNCVCKSRHLSRCFFFSKQNERIQPDAVWDINLVDAARSAAIFVVVDRVSKLVNVHQESVNLSFENVPDTYIPDLVAVSVDLQKITNPRQFGINRNKTFPHSMQKIAAVTVDDVKRVAQKYMTKIFSKTEAKTAVVCNAREGPKIAEGLKK